MTLHPDPSKHGVNISQGKYDIMREAILACIRAAGELPFSDLREAVTDYLGGKFDGSIGWYVTTVKLDLEARGLIQRAAGHQKQVLQLI